MTEIQAAQIEEMRVHGKGYKTIASVVGLSRDIVRNYCKAKGMEGYGETVVLNMLRRQADVKTGRTFKITARRQDA